MITKIQSIVNERERQLDIFIEPAAESFVLLPNQIAKVQMHYEDNSEPLEIAVHETYVTIFEAPGVALEIFVDDEMKYYSDYRQSNHL